MVTVIKELLSYMFIVCLDRLHLIFHELWLFRCLTVNVSRPTFATIMLAVAKTSATILACFHL